MRKRGCITDYVGVKEKAYVRQGGYHHYKNAQSRDWKTTLKHGEKHG
jgi:hypothetical protein